MNNKLTELQSKLQFSLEYKEAIEHLKELQGATKSSLITINNELNYLKEDYKINLKHLEKAQTYLKIKDCSDFEEMIDWLLDFEFEVKEIMTSIYYLNKTNLEELINYKNDSYYERYIYLAINENLTIEHIRPILKVLDTKHYQTNLLILEVLFLRFYNEFGVLHYDIFEDLANEYNIYSTYLK